MGGIWIKRGQLIGSTSEIIGYKSGLGLTKEEFEEIIPEKFQQVWIGNNQELLRIRSEEFENLISVLLYRVGNIESPSNVPSTIRLFKKYKNNPRFLAIYNDLMESFILFLKRVLKGNLQTKTIDPTPFILEANKKY
ncbi:hypothetical protein [Lysinibacillus varians]|uniref:Uncharacterized protein n=1 Tax=Lysinibacillus varians TaxID=1145276 RepID=A0ABY2T4N4_9BACI|nr:hypothetical protein [Lysinibacillus varians]AHN24416.1 hypothetical protein T479_17000 [Lysinibacillus varians]TKI51132.1 hypothetical protein FC752_22480 [Lysinibacillus varians]